MSNQSRTDKYRKQSREKYLLVQARHRAKKKDLEFNIDLSDIIVPVVCPVFGTPFQYEGRTLAVSTIDRIDNSKGYVKGNVQVISLLANTMKACATEEQLKAFARWVLDV